MRFTIVKNSGSNQPPQLSYDFSAPGGTIGRSTENNWYLPDENLDIARLQVIVSISVDGECRINNQGSASEVLLNLIPLAPDRQIEVRNGDMLNIGNYQIQLIDTNKSSSRQAATQVANAEHPVNPNQTRVPNEVWDDLEQILTSDTSFPPNSHQTIQSQIKQELNDNNPLIKGQLHDKERNPIDPLAQIEATTDLDALQLRATDPISMFKSDTTFQQENILNDHTPTTLLTRNEQYHDQNDKKQEIDPLKLFSDKHIKPAQHAKNDDLLNQMLDNAVPLNPVNDVTISQSESQFPFVSKPSKPAESFELFEPFEPSETASAPTDKSVHNKTQTFTQVFSLPPQEEALHNDQDRYKDQYSYKDQERHKDQTGSVRLEGKLLTALLDGMGLKDINHLQFDEQHMHQLGLLISQLTQGIITLNASRTQLKNEVNASMTQALTDINNPFKLLPSGQSVLALMLGDPIPGFMPLELATRDILIELQAHQLGMIAGIRAIATNILHLFQPTILEQKARENHWVPRLSLLSTQKAAMWDYFIKHYQRTVSEFEQDSVLFSENFLQAYETEVNRFKNTQN
ncbi:type VI secretion system-associated FHA domain protein [Xenorhabdus anantnagensis]|uniref:FHA domain-containing protein n=1 Tax=Xenorhabdus anantnagensis TaxID=3025875 RepID=A0ABT5LPA7_9GAMM|nr:FHA domain-containing protein [Xenorhabdus anantnagensis]MDC9596155.1 FHA domain-containing protein [Xenorhabdus anantnagensis]